MDIIFLSQETKFKTVAYLCRDLSPFTGRYDNSPSPLLLLYPKAELALSFGVGSKARSLLYRRVCTV